VQVGRTLIDHYATRVSMSPLRERRGREGVLYLRDMVQPRKKVDLSSSQLRYLVLRIGE